ncbi:MAG: MnhB domain-containing protein [Actinomycetota bacterium]
MISSRSIVVRTGIRLASPLALVVAGYLFFAGHNQPGGGFAAGLVLGAVVALRAVVGLVTPRRASWILALGGTIAGLVAVAPIVAGHTLLDQVVVETTLPLLGKVKAGSALVFDLGVTILVVGLIVAVLEALDVYDLRSRTSRSVVQSDGARVDPARVAAQPTDTESIGAPDDAGIERGGTR